MDVPNCVEQVGHDGLLRHPQRPGRQPRVLSTDEHKTDHRPVSEIQPSQHRGRGRGVLRRWLAGVRVTRREHRNAAHLHGASEQGSRVRIAADQGVQRGISDHIEDDLSCRVAVIEQ